MLTVLLLVEDYSYTGCFSTTQAILSSDLVYLSLLPESLCQPRLGLLLPGGSDGKESACNAGDLGSIPWSGRSPGEGNGNPFEYSCLGNPTDRGVWRATVHGVTKSQT